VGRWSKTGVPVVPDSSFYIRHPHKLETVDFFSIGIDFEQDDGGALAPTGTSCGTRSSPQPSPE